MEVIHHSAYGWSYKDRRRLTYYGRMRSKKGTYDPGDPGPDISFCIVNTNKCELLLTCLDSIFSRPPTRTYEVLVIDNASEDGSVLSVKELYGDRVRLIELSRRTAKPVCDTELLRASNGRYSLLLNEDSELQTGAADTLYDALEQSPDAAAAGAKLFRPLKGAQPSAWRFPGLLSALLGLLTLGKLGVVQSKGTSMRKVDWAQSAALMIRGEAFEDVGDLDPRFFVYSDEVDWCRRAYDRGWEVLYVPAAHVNHHEQLANDVAYERRVVEFCRNRDLYLRTHHSSVIATTVKLITAATYAVRALIAVFLPGHSPKRYWLHVTQSLFPNRGEGLREAAEEHNRQIEGSKMAG